MKKNENMLGGGGSLTDPFAGIQANRTNQFNAATSRLAAGQGTGISDLSTYGAGITPRSNTQDPLVYVGSGQDVAYQHQSAASQLYYRFDDKTKSKFLSQLELAGYQTGNLKDAQLAQLWAGYVDVAAKYGASGQWLSPWDVIGKDIAQRESAVAKPRTTTQTATSYNLSTAEDAHALFQDISQKLLGRAPTKAEISSFKTILNKYERANPSVTTTTSKYLGSDLQSQTSTTSGGTSQASEQLLAEEEAKKNPEYGAFQAATTGMDWLLQAINGGA